MGVSAIGNSQQLVVFSQDEAVLSSIGSEEENGFVVISDKNEILFEDNLQGDDLPTLYKKKEIIPHCENLRINKLINDKVDEFIKNRTHLIILTGWSATAIGGAWGYGAFATGYIYWVLKSRDSIITNTLRKELRKIPNPLPNIARQLSVNNKIPQTLEEAKKHYKDLQLQYHPDKNKDPSATAKSAEINEAFEKYQLFWKAGLRV